MIKQILYFQLILFCVIFYKYGERSSVGRAPDCGSGCRGFEPHRSPQDIMIFVISGPSGVGKGTIIRKLLEENPNYTLAISATTRPPRTGEIHGSDYFFLSETEFDLSIKNNEFLEWCQVHTSRYGTLKKEIETLSSNSLAIIIEIDVQGAEKIRQHQDINQRHIFLVPPSIEILENRLRKRNTESDTEIKKRITEAKNELSKQNHYQHVIVNNELTQSVFELNNIILKELAEGVIE